MSNEEALQILFKWIGCNSSSGETYDIRMRIAGLATTYGLKVVNLTNLCMLRAFGKCQKLMQWNYSVGFPTLLPEL